MFTFFPILGANTSILNFSREVTSLKVLSHFPVFDAKLISNFMKLQSRKVCLHFFKFLTRKNLILARNFKIQILLKKWENWKTKRLYYILARNLSISIGFFSWNAKHYETVQFTIKDGVVSKLIFTGGTSGAFLMI